MSKKHTYEFVKNYFEEQGCELLEEEYKNCKTKMRYRCVCGNISKIVFDSFKRGKRCMKCKGPQKYTFKSVKQYFEERGCELLEKTYKGYHSPLEYKCNCGEISKIQFSHFKQGQRCRKCRNKKIGEKLRFRIDAVKNIFFINNCQLLEKIYKNNRTPMKYKCSCGNISKIDFNSFKKGVRCSK